MFSSYGSNEENKIYAGHFIHIHKIQWSWQWKSLKQLQAPTESARSPNSTGTVGKYRSLWNCHLFVKSACTTVCLDPPGLLVITLVEVLRLLHKRPQYSRQRQHSYLNPVCGFLPSIQHCPALKCLSAMNGRSWWFLKHEGCGSVSATSSNSKQKYSFTSVKMAASGTSIRVNWPVTFLLAFSWLQWNKAKSLETCKLHNQPVPAYIKDDLLNTTNSLTPLPQTARATVPKRP